MVRKLIAASFIVSSAAFGVMAQYYPDNARINALGGSFIVDDASDVLRYSAYMNTYTDIAQVTFDAPIWGVKSLGEKFNIGVVANRPLMLNNPVEQGEVFYDQAATAAKTVAENMTGISTTQNVPHILLGMNLSSVQLGLDLFYENAHYRLHVKDEPEGGTSTETKVSGSIRNPGGIISAIFGSGDAKIAVKGGIGFPGMSVTREVTTENTDKTEAKSEKGLFSVLGGEYSFKTGKLDATLGADWVHSHFQFKNAEGVTSNTFYNNKFDFYAGAIASIDSSSFVTLTYDFRLKNSGNHPDNTSHDARRIYQNVVSSIFYAGYENTWTCEKLFDKFIARAGASYTISSTVDHEKGDGDGGSYTSRTKHETDYSQIDPRLGLGIVKKIFALDVTVDPAVWAGLISGPKVGTVTLTLDF